MRDAPRLITFLLRHALIGFAIGIAFVLCLLHLDVGELGTLIGAEPSGLVAASALAFVMGITFGSVQMGFAVMLLPDTEERPQRLR